jgi:PHP domain
MPHSISFAPPKDCGVARHPEPHTQAAVLTTLAQPVSHISSSHVLGTRGIIKMAFTMHSHSGQFCPGHAKDQLEAIVQHAISQGYATMGLTEHMPRYDKADLYPEEVRRLIPS